MSAEELERVHALLDALSHDEAIGNRRLAGRVREVLSAGAVTPARLTALLTALESANTESRALRQSTSKFRVRRSAVDRVLSEGATVEGGCPKGYHMDPDTKECVADADARDTRPVIPKSKSTQDMQLSDVIARLVEGSRRIEAATEVVRKSVSEARLADREGRAFLAALDLAVRKRRSPLLESLDELVRRGR